MKTLGPLVIGFVAGAIALLELFVPKVSGAKTHLLDYAIILAAAAYVLGAINILQVNYPKIRRREKDWGYKVVLLGAAAFMLIVGVDWTDVPKDAQPFAMAEIAGSSASADEVALSFEGVPSDAVIQVDGAKTVPASKDGAPLVLPLAAGAHTITVSKDVAGYGQAGGEITVEQLGPGQFRVGINRAKAGAPPDVVWTTGAAIAVKAELPSRFGKEGRIFTWLYDHVFYPCNATMFALLAFFIASAAFRAFRARNLEAGLLLGAAILVLIGRVPIGRAISDVFPTISDWLVAIPNNAGRRAIIMGAALGAIATGLRIILGLERSHMGAE